MVCMRWYPFLQSKNAVPVTVSQCCLCQSKYEIHICALILHPRCAPFSKSDKETMKSACKEPCSPLIEQRLSKPKANRSHSSIFLFFPPHPFFLSALQNPTFSLFLLPFHLQHTTPSTPSHLPSPTKPPLPPPLPIPTPPLKPSPQPLPHHPPTNQPTNPPSLTHSPLHVPLPKPTIPSHPIPSPPTHHNQKMPTSNPHPNPHPHPDPPSPPSPSSVVHKYHECNHIHFTSLLTSAQRLAALPADHARLPVKEGLCPRCVERVVVGVLRRESGGKE